jgi:hypothetical protein
MYERYMSMGPEVKEINWKQARGALYRWPQVMREWLSRATLVRFHTDTNYSYAHQHVSANYRSCLECLSPYPPTGEWLQRRHGTDRYIGPLW